MASSLSQLSASVTRILSLNGFPKELKTRDIQAAFSEFDNASGGFKIKWLDDTSLLVVFADATVGESFDPLINIAQISITMCRYPPLLRVLAPSAFPHVPNAYYFISETCLPSHPGVSPAHVHHSYVCHHRHY